MIASLFPATPRNVGSGRVSDINRRCGRLFESIELPPPFGYLALRACRNALVEDVWASAGKYGHVGRKLAQGHPAQDTIVRSACCGKVPVILMKSCISVTMHLSPRRILLTGCHPSPVGAPPLDRATADVGGRNARLSPECSEPPAQGPSPFRLIASCMVASRSSENFLTFCSSSNFSWRVASSANSFSFSHSENFASSLCCASRDTNPWYFSAWTARSWKHTTDRSQAALADCASAGAGVMARKEISNACSIGGRLQTDTDVAPVNGTDDLL
jgi:hypothetical protein